MKLNDIIKKIKPVAVKNFKDVEVKALVNDSRKVKDGSLFVAIHGEHLDGSAYIEDALKRDAVAIVTESNIDFTVPPAVPVIIVEDARAALSTISAVFFGNPSKKMKVVGVTGTNGKTTVSHQVRNIMETAGFKTGLIGTIKYVIGKREIPAFNTTPDALLIQEYLNEMYKQNITHAVMEVSSHSLTQHRVDDVLFDAAIFTNLTPEHLDYHKDFDDYKRAKFRLFARLPEKGKAVVNMDDPSGREILSFIDAQVLTYSLDAEADIRGKIREMDLNGTDIEISYNSNSVVFRYPLTGRFNAYNTLASFTAARAMGIRLEQVIKGLSEFKGVKGRLERVKADADFHIFIDYAHTDDALMNVLSTVKPLVRGKLIVVFGCGGDRDKTKRPRMGKVASMLADKVVITSDNPRSEDPLKIIADIQKGIIKKADVTTIADRKEAIEFAVSHAEPGDLIIIAGKGHESYQIFKDTIIDFDDYTEAERAVKALARSK